MESRMQTRYDDQVWALMLTQFLTLVAQFVIAVTFFKGYYVFGFFLGAIPVICWDCFTIPTVRMCNENRRNLTVGKYFSESWNDTVSAQEFNAPMILKQIIAFLFLLIVNSVRGVRYLLLPFAVTLIAKLLQLQTIY